MGRVQTSTGSRAPAHVERGSRCSGFARVVAHGRSAPARRSGDSAVAASLSRRQRFLGEPLIEDFEALLHSGGQFPGGPSSDEDRARSLAEKEHETGEDRYGHRGRSANARGQGRQRISVLQDLSATERRVGRRGPPSTQTSIWPSLSPELRPRDELLECVCQGAALVRRTQIDGAYEELAAAPWVHPFCKSSVDLRLVSPRAKPRHCAARWPARKPPDSRRRHHGMGHVLRLPGASRHRHGVRAASPGDQHLTSSRTVPGAQPSPRSPRGGRAREGKRTRQAGLECHRPARSWRRT
jgi:hypothetical protein